MSPYLNKFKAARLPEAAKGVFDIGMTITEEIEIELELPDNYKLNSDKRKHMMKSNKGYFLVEIKTQKNTVEFEREIIFNQPRYEPDNGYQYARKLILKFNDRESNQILIP